MPYGLVEPSATTSLHRQLVALTTFSDLVQEARERVKRDALAAGLPDDGKPLRDGGTGATAYAEAVAMYLGFVWMQTTRDRTVLRCANGGDAIDADHKHVSVAKQYLWSGTSRRRVSLRLQPETSSRSM